MPSGKPPGIRGPGPGYPNENWYPWFAWKPVRYQDSGRWAWLKTIMRREVILDGTPRWSLFEDPALVEAGLDKRSQFIKKYGLSRWNDDR